MDTMIDKTYNKSLDNIFMPARVKRLPVSPKGFPVPWFVQWFENGEPCEHGKGEPDFRVIDTPKIGYAVRHERCWVCGDKLGGNLAFTIGPMCSITRTISEPPSHLECATFSACACPFLTEPRMKRNEKNIPGMTVPAAGLPIPRNPGAVCVWVTKSFKVFKPPRSSSSGVLFTIGPPERVTWYAQGKPATREQVMASIDSGYPLLVEQANLDGPAGMRALEQQRKQAMTLVPAE